VIILIYHRLQKPLPVATLVLQVESTIDTSTSVPPINIITTSVTHGSYFLQGIASEAVFAPSTGRPTICKFFFYLTGYLVSRV